MLHRTLAQRIVAATSMKSPPRRPNATNLKPKTYLQNRKTTPALTTSDEKSISASVRPRPVSALSIHS